VHIRLVLVVLASAFLATPAFGITISPTAQDRYFRTIHTDEPGNQTVTTETAPSFQPFAVDMGVAGHQFSSIGVDSLTGDLFARSTALGSQTTPEETWIRTSYFLVEFDLSEPAAWSIQGMVDADGAGDTQTASRLLFSVFDSGAGDFVPLASWYEDDTSGPLPVSGSGTIAPGSYQFVASAHADANHNQDTNLAGRAYTDFTLTLSELPEPASGWLLAAGLLVSSVTTRGRFGG
jgi:hypothetical protein